MSKFKAGDTVWIKQDPYLYGKEKEYVPATVRYPECVYVVFPDHVSTASVHVNRVFPRDPERKGDDRPNTKTKRKAKR